MKAFQAGFHLNSWEIMSHQINSFETFLAMGKANSNKGKKHLETSKGTVVMQHIILPQLVGEDCNPTDLIITNLLCDVFEIEPRVEIFYNVQ